MPRYIAFHKPYGVLSQFTGADPSRTLAAFGLPAGVYAAGRLDRDSEGLLLLTDDGPFIKRLLSPAFAHPRRYLAQVEGLPDAAALTALANGPMLKEGRSRPCGAKLLDVAPDLPPRQPPVRYRAAIPTAWLLLTLHEGRNRQVRRMTAAIGHPTLRLVRVEIAALALGDLAPGQWREVRAQDVLPPDPPPPSQRPRPQQPARSGPRFGTRGRRTGTRR